MNTQEQLQPLAAGQAAPLTPLPLTLIPDPTHDGSENYWAFSSGEDYHTKHGRTGFNMTAFMHRDEAEFIHRACNSQPVVIAALERAKRELSDCEDHLVCLRPDVQPDPYVVGCREAITAIEAALAAATKTA